MAKVKRKRKRKNSFGGDADGEEQQLKPRCTQCIGKREQRGGGTFRTQSRNLYIFACPFRMQFKYTSTLLHILLFFAVVCALQLEYPRDPAPHLGACVAMLVPAGLRHAEALALLSSPPANISVLIKRNVAKKHVRT